MAAHDVAETQVQNENLFQDREKSQECPICFGEFKADEKFQLLPCAHKFHLDCLETYTSTKDKHWADIPCVKCNTTASHVATLHVDVDATNQEHFEDGQSRSTNFETQLEGNLLEGRAAEESIHEEDLDPDMIE